MLQTQFNEKGVLKWQHWGKGKYDFLKVSYASGRVAKDFPGFHDNDVHENTGKETL